MKKQSLVKVFVALPAILTSSLPILSCSLCWPAYTALLGAMGLSFFNYAPLLLPLISIFILIALFFFWKNSYITGNYWPLVIGVVSGAGVIVGKFVLSSFWILGFSIIGFAASSIMNLISAHKQECNSCGVKKNGG